MKRWERYKPNMSETIKLSDLIEVLECPVCTGLPRTQAVYQCANGHTLCEVCRKRLREKVCPSCRQPLGEIRNRTIEKIMESIITYHCRFTKLGCTQSMTKENLTEHEEHCGFRYVSYPSTLSSFEISLAKLTPKLKARKGITLKGSGKVHFETISEEKKAVKVEWNPVHIRCKKKDFFFLLSYDGINYHAWMYFAGTIEETKQFQCLIEIYRSHQTVGERITYTGPATSMDVKVEKNPVISIDNETIKSVIENNTLKIRLNVSKL